MKKQILILVCALLAILSCTPEDNFQPQEAQVSDFADMQFSYEGKDTCSFTILSGFTWSLDTKGADWVILSQNSGKAQEKAVVRVCVEPNDDIARTATLKLCSGPLAQSVTLTQAAFPIVPEMKIEGIEGNKYSYSFTQTEPDTLFVYSNVDWTAVKEGLDWVDVSPMEGARKQTTMVIITPSMNTGAARSGKILFKGPGLEDSIVEISQEAYDSTPRFQAIGLEQTDYTLSAMLPEAISFTLRASNQSWTIDKCGAEWITINDIPTSATLIQDIPVTISFANNSASASRSAKVSFTPSDASLGAIILNITQEGLSSNFSAVWTLDAKVTARNEQWLSTGVAYDDVRNATMTWNRVNEASFYANASLASFTYTKSNNSYMVKDVWTGDYMQFDVPVKYIEAGTKVNISFKIKANSLCPRFWWVEYYDGTKWAKTSTTQKKVYGGDTLIDCTAAYEDGVNMEVNETFTVANTIIDGKIQVRLVCVDGSMAAAKSTIQTKGSTSHGIYFTTGVNIEIKNID